MVGGKVFITQVQEIVIIHDIFVEFINLDNTFVEHIKFLLATYITFNVGLAVNDALQMVALIKKFYPL